nr:RNA-directed DNA polymerase, eukaryota [Tanacetum cinerariifolium]
MPAASSNSTGFRQPKAQDHAISYLNVVNGSSAAVVPGPYISSASALVLEDSCVVERDLSKYATCKVKDVNSIPNLRTLFMDEDAVHDFVSDERIVWVDIEGIPLNVWSREIFMRIGKKWGETLDSEDNVDSSFGRKSLCIKTKQQVSILESFKIIFKAHSPFSEEVSGDDSESDVEEVSETIFGDNSSSSNNNSDEMGKQHSEDPFKIYDILKKQTGGETRENDQGAEEFSSLVNAKVMNNSQEVYQEINMESVDPNVVKEGGSVLGVLEDMIWVGQAMGEAVGNSGGILCVWEANIFKKDYATISDNFDAIYGTWLPSNSKILFVAIYAPQQASCKRVLWEYVSTLIGRWNGETIIFGDFNEVRSIDERRSSCFNPSSARVFDHFISSSGLVDVRLEGYTFTWSHPSGSKMSKLDRFLISEGIFLMFPSITALCLDRHLSDHRSILFREVYSDFGPIPFWFYHSWFNLEGFYAMVEQTWRSFSHSNINRMIHFKKKLQDLKAIIRCWVKDKRMHRSGEKNSIKNELSDIDKEVDRRVVSDTNLFRRLELQCKLHDINQMEAKDSFQKSKIKWAIEGDENSKFFHDIINKKRSQLAIRGVFDNGLWCTVPDKLKRLFLITLRLERNVSRDEIRLAVWNYGENKSPGPDGYTFEFFRKYWNIVGPDFCEAVEYFFETGLFSKGCNSSFVALIPKVADAKFVNDFHLISLTGSVYKVVTKILTNRLALVIADLVFDTQSVFVANRQILDEPFILNEILHWCERKKKQVMFCKVDFAMAYDSVRWDYLLDVLEAFRFGQTWCKWIRGTFSFAKASVLVNGSPSNEFSFHCGLKQGDPLSPYLFVLIMESLHMSFSRAVDEGLKINIHKSQVLGVGIPRSIVINFFNGIDSTVKKITWAAWDKILVSKKNDGLGVSSFNALNRALPLKWVWRFISQDGSLWLRVIQALYEPSIVSHPVNLSSIWCSIVHELHLLTDKELDKEVLVADKIKAVVGHSFRHPVRAGSEHQQMVDLNSLLEWMSFSQSHDRWFCDLTGDGEFWVKEVRNFLDNFFLPSHFESTRWVKYIPIKINVFAWRARRDYLPTRANLNRRGIILDSYMCPLCQSYEEDINHVLFRCELARIIIRRICRWWELDWQGLMSFSDWQSWFSSIRLPYKVKNMLEGVFCVAWWSIRG